MTGRLAGTLILMGTLVNDTLRTAMYAALLVLLLVIPTVLGFAVASAGSPRIPESNQASAPAPPSEAVPPDQQVVSRAPIGDAPSTAEEALTPRDDSIAGIPRIRYITPATGEVRLHNGDAIPLGDDVSMTLNVSPFPPDEFDVDVEISLSRDGRPVTDASIDTVWDMIVMGHGPFDSPVTHVADGTYTASYDFFMFGPWQLDTELRIPGIESIQFALSIYVWPA